MYLRLTSKPHEGRCGSDFYFSCGVNLLILLFILTKESGFYCDVLQIQDVKIHEHEKYMK